MAKINPNIRAFNTSKKEVDIEYLVKGINEGNRFALSKAITLIESEKNSDIDLAAQLLDAIIPNKNSSLRIGITGAPGAGKSTLIEALGTYLTNQDINPAILAIDPSSKSTGGSILGDKTRMQILSQSSKAYIRPSAAGKTMGGVAGKTRESIFLVETAGFDPVIVETVGVGQSETAVRSMTDIFVLVISPASGDDLQGIKRGIMELADIIVVNKMDGDLKHAASETLLHYSNALKLLRNVQDRWTPKIIGISALEKHGIDELWNEIIRFKKDQEDKGLLQKLRLEQDIRWFEEYVNQGISMRVLARKKIKKEYDDLRNKVKEGKTTSFLAAHEFFKVSDE